MMLMYSCSAPLQNRLRFILTLTLGKKELINNNKLERCYSAYTHLEWAKQDERVSKSGEERKRREIFVFNQSANGDKLGVRWKMRELRGQKKDWDGEILWREWYRLINNANKLNEVIMQLDNGMTWGERGWVWLWDECRMKNERASWGDRKWSLKRVRGTGLEWGS